MAGPTATEAAPFLARLTRLDPDALVRLRPAGPDRVVLWGRVPWGVLVTRTVPGGAVGDVVSDRMNKTIVVRVKRRFRHPRFKKVVTAYSKFYAHDEKNEAKVGDRVRIQETRPLSKTKSWRLVEVVERTREVAKVA